MCLARKSTFLYRRRYCSFFKCLSSFGDILKARLRVLNQTVNLSFKCQSPVFKWEGGVGIFGGQVRISIIQSVSLERYLFRKEVLKTESSFHSLKIKSTTWERESQYWSTCYQISHHPLPSLTLAHCGPFSSLIKARGPLTAGKKILFHPLVDA